MDPMKENVLEVEVQEMVAGNGDDNLGESKAYEGGSEENEPTAIKHQPFAGNIFLRHVHHHGAEELLL